jgi:hypothetical protein
MNSEWLSHGCQAIWAGWLLVGVQQRRTTHNCHLCGWQISTMKRRRKGEWQKLTRLFQTEAEAVVRPPAEGREGAASWGTGAGYQNSLRNNSCALEALDLMPNQKGVASKKELSLTCKAVQGGTRLYKAVQGGTRLRATLNVGVAAAKRSWLYRKTQRCLQGNSNDCTV